MAQIEEVHEPAKKVPRKKNVPTFVKYYLILYNALSAIAWSYVLIGTLVHLFALDNWRSPSLLSTLSRKRSSIPYLSSAAPFLGFGSSRFTWIESKLPVALVPVFRRATTTYARVGYQTAIIQSFAILEVVHALLGWVGSDPMTTLMQVASRYMLVWGIAPQYTAAQTTPFYASMVLSWSITEVIRYAHFAITLLGYEPYVLLYLRYTTFYLLYPTGASSEAFCMYATLPSSGEPWSLYDIFRAVLFGIWWPGLYVMYMHMVKRRRKVLGGGKGRTLGAKPKSL
ncbi:unnamed protein product [Somion occarium]|uniref:Very-long-chain (3R)-3-hydroxyacyl-CoA dehydratase n=1 Tax=Somion occarium TaxID=3059160 RepID=A0ABP1DFG0_9APHY